VAETKPVESARAKSQKRVRQLLGIAERPPTRQNSDEDGISSKGASYEPQERFGPYGLGHERTLESFESALGVRFGPGPEPNELVAGVAGSTNLKNWWRPSVVSLSAKWGGQPPETYSENDNTNAALLLTLSRAMAF